MVVAILQNVPRKESPFFHRVIDLMTLLCSRGDDKHRPLCRYRGGGRSRSAANSSGSRALLEESCPASLPQAHLGSYKGCVSYYRSLVSSDVWLAVGYLVELESLSIAY